MPAHKKLTPEQAAEMVARYLDLCTVSALKRHYGISRPAVYRYLKEAEVPLKCPRNLKPLGEKK